MAPDPTPVSKIPAPASLLDQQTSALPSATRNALLSHLQDSTTIPRLNNLLTDSLTRTGWTDKIHDLALELLRNGDCANFGEVLSEVSRRACQGINKSNGEANGANASNADSIDVKIPQEVIEKSVKFLKDEIEGVVDVIHDDKSGPLSNGVNGHKK